jgi:hypothetical protein
MLERRDADILERKDERTRDRQEILAVRHALERLQTTLESKDGDSPSFSQANA